MSTVEWSLNVTLKNGILKESFFTSIIQADAPAKLVLADDEC